MTEIVRGSPARVVTDSGTVTADSVVVAGNAYHALDGAPRNVMLPVHSFISATETLALPIVGEIRSWQAAFFVVGLPGVVLAALVFSMPAPVRR